jgi:hypothetical protein
MPKEHNFFDSDDEDRKSLDQFRQENTSIFSLRDKQIKKAKKLFPEKLKTIKLHTPYTIDSLVVDIFYLRFEEGLRELLNSNTKYEETPKGIIFTEIAPQ